MDLGIKGASTLVVGGGGGLGGAICQALAAEGARVAVAGPRSESVDAVVDRIHQDGGDAFGLTLDLGDLESFPAAVDHVRDRQGDVAILVNLTGGPPPTSAASVAPEMWLAQFRSMVLGVIALTDLVLPAMRSRGWGRIITSTSSGAVTPIANLGISNTLRVALHGWSKTLAGEVGADGVTVNVVVPGRIATARVARLDAAKAAAGAQYARARCRGQRWSYSLAPLWNWSGVRRRGGLPGQCRGVIHHRLDAARGRRADPVTMSRP